jgi:proteasome lid subunit RPN8/RPN11
MSRRFCLILPFSVYEPMIDQAKAELPNECCGLLAGTVDANGVARVIQHYPLINSAASPVLFESDPRSMFDALRALDRAGLEILAVYHSHPTSAPIPSRTDLDRNYSEDVMNLIISLASDPPLTRAWWLTAQGCEEGNLTLQ